jgi:prevent-host-death family protein
MSMKSIKASEFKAKCLRLMDDVETTGEGLVVTKNGRPVARLVPYVERPLSLWGLHKSSIEVLQDLVPSVDESWDAES